MQVALSTPRTSGLSAICSCCRTPDTRVGRPTPRNTHAKCIVTGSVTRLVPSTKRTSLQRVLSPVSQDNQPSTASWEKGYSRTSAAPTTIVSLMSRLIFPQEWKHLATAALQGHNLHLSLLFFRLVRGLLVLFWHNLHAFVLFLRVVFDLGPPLT